MSHLLDEVQMKALGCVMHLRDQPSQLLFRQAFVPLAAQLELDDVGYFYCPSHPELLYTVPGQMVGQMNNRWLPTFQFGIGVRAAVSALNSVDEDYKKLLVIATDYAKESDLYYFEKAVEEADPEMTIVLYTFGKKWNVSLADHCLLRPNTKFYGDKDIKDVEDLLASLSL
jgi:hypothetical protein